MDMVDDTLEGAMRRLARDLRTTGLCPRQINAFLGFSIDRYPYFDFARSESVLADAITKYEALSSIEKAHHKSRLPRMLSEFVAACQSRHAALDLAALDEGLPRPEKQDRAQHGAGEARQSA